MNRLALRFHVGSIPVEVTPSFWLLVVLLGFRNSASGLALWVAAVFVGILVHELGHAYTARLFGATPRIQLHGFGGITVAPLPEGTSHPRLKQAAVTMAGPMAGFLFGGVVLGAWVLFRQEGLPPWLVHAVYLLLWINIGWGVINLLPVLPMDGGNLVRVALSGPGQVTGLMRALAITVVVGIPLTLLALRYQWYWAGFLFGLFVYQAIRQMMLLRKELQDAKLHLDERLQRAFQATDERRLDEAIEHAKFVAQHAHQPERKIVAQHALAQAWMVAGQPERALEVLETIPASETDPMLHGAVLLEAERHAEAIPHLRQAYESGEYPMARAMYLRALEKVGDQEEIARVLQASSSGG